MDVAFTAAGVVNRMDVAFMAAGVVNRMDVALMASVVESRLFFRASTGIGEGCYQYYSRVVSRMDLVNTSAEVVCSIADYFQ